MRKVSQKFDVGGFNMPHIQFDYSKIDKNTIVICSDETLASVYGKEINERMKEVGLTSIHSNNDLGTKMFWAE